MKLDKWQKELLEHNGNISLRSGRQVGKSTIVGMKAAKFATTHANTNTLIIAAAQRQSTLLFEKVKAEVDQYHIALLEKAGGFKPQTHLSARRNLELRREYELKHGIYKEQPTKTEINLKNGSRIYSLPAGRTGYFIRGFTLDILIADEAAFIPETVWVAVSPMVAVSRKTRGFGWLILLSTPFGKGGFFYESCFDSDFKQFHVSSEACPRIPKDFLRKERQRLSKIEYAQEYLGEFVDEFNQFFPTALIKQCMTFMEWPFQDNYSPQKDYFMGVDIARYGEDENAFVIAELDPSAKTDNHFKVVLAETTERVSLDKTFNRILAYDNKWKFKRIFIDDAGIGAGVTDLLIERLGRRVLGLNNAKRTIDKEGRPGKIFKEDLYSNAAVMMEQNQLELINSLKLLRSLKCMTFEYSANKNLHIHGKYSHLAEAFVRVCWAKKAKHLNLFCY
tara:strand:+ start:290 stop:1636 length:1347 start_codon:yes stop_codon:yes gene_type:complete